MLNLDEVKQYLRVDSSDEDALIANLMETADSLVRDISRREADDDTTAGPVMRAAELYAVCYLFEHREEADYQKLTLTLRALLCGVREAKF